jgi:hypothetical protein
MRQAADLGGNEYGTAARPPLGARRDGADQAGVVVAGYQGHPGPAAGDQAAQERQPSHEMVHGDLVRRD